MSSKQELDMCAKFIEPQFTNETDVKMVGPGHDDHYITTPIKPLYDIDDVCSVGLSYTEPGDETCVFALEDEDDGTALHHYGPADEFYYILEGEFTLWWGTDAANLEHSRTLVAGDCAYYPTGWKYKVKNTGDTPGKYFYVMTTPPGIKRRLP